MMPMEIGPPMVRLTRSMLAEPPGRVQRRRVRVEQGDSSAARGRAILDTWGASTAVGPKVGEERRCRGVARGGIAGRAGLPGAGEEGGRPRPVRGPAAGDGPSRRPG